ncbi:MAG: hypothetical protein ABSC50_02140 [Candidatus Bathyarchaeia archaeon]|jgi:hypothetical protein
MTIVLEGASLERFLLPVAAASLVAALLVALIVYEVRRYGRRRQLNARILARL